MKTHLFYSNAMKSISHASSIDPPTNGGNLGWLAAVIVAMLLAISASGQVTADGNGKAAAAASTSANITTLTVPSVTVPPGANTVLMVIIRGTLNATASTITYNGQNLARWGSPVSSGAARMEIWYRSLGNVATNITSDVVVTWGTAHQYAAVMAASYKNVDQVTPLNAIASNATNSVTATSLPITVTGAVGDMAVDAISSFGIGTTPASYIAGAGQTDEATANANNATTSAMRISASRKPITSGTSVSLDWAISGMSGSVACVHIGAALRFVGKFYPTAANGNWNSAATWVNGTIPPATLNAGDRIQVLHNVDLNTNYAVATNTTLEIGAAGALTVKPGMTLTNGGNVTNTGTLTNNGVVSDAGTTTFNGTLAQSVGGSVAPDFNRVVINNASGVTFNTNAHVADKLTLTNGNVTMAGTNTLTIGTLGTITRTSGFVIGTLKKEFAGIGNFTYPVGTAAGYAPVTAVVNTLGGGDFSVTANDGALAGTIAGQSLTRNWSLVKNGISSADITLNYNDADVPAGADESQFQFVRRSTNTNIQIVPTSFDTTANSFTLLGVTGFSDWGLGKMAGPLAAMVDVSGRITTANGRGITNVRVALTDQNGFTRYVNSSSFGYYRFTEIESGQMYTLTVGAKRFTFTEPTRLIFVFEAMANQDFVADP